MLFNSYDRQLDSGLQIHGVAHDVTFSILFILVTEQRKDLESNLT